MKLFQHSWAEKRERSELLKNAGSAYALAVVANDTKRMARLKAIIDRLEKEPLTDGKD